MKIVHKLKLGAVGGLETHALTLSLAQKEAGHDVSIVIAGPRGPISDLMETKGLPVYYAGAKSETDILGALRVRKILKQLKPDIIHSHGMERAALFSVGRLKAIRVTTAHCYPSMAIQGILLRKSMSFIDRWMIKLTDGYIAVTEDVCRAYAKHKYFTHRPWKVVHNGIDLLKFYPDPGFTLPTEGSGRPKELLMATRMDPEKHPDDAIRILALLRDRHGLDVRLTLCGAGKLLSRCEKLVEELGVSDFVTFAGQRHDMNELMRRSHGLFVLSDHETFALVPLEGIASGCPVFAYRIAGGFHEWFQGEGCGGVISEARTPESLAQKIVPILSDQSRWEQMRTDALATSKNFSGTVMAQKTMEFYQTLL